MVFTLPKLFLISSIGLPLVTAFHLPSTLASTRTLRLSSRKYHPNEKIPFNTSPSSLSTNLSMQKTDAEWKQLLTPEQYFVLREEGTERPWTSPLNDVKEEGVYRCAGCNAPLFSSSSKYESGSGWPSFFDPIDANSIDLSVDFKLVVPRTEVTCKSCGGHLGHVFDDGPRPTGKRYCMNGVAMEFISTSEDPDLAESVHQRVENSTTIKVPVAAVVPGLALDLVVAGLFLSSFVSKNGANGLNLFANGVSIYQMVQLVPLGIGLFYASSAFKKLGNLF